MTNRLNGIINTINASIACKAILAKNTSIIGSPYAIYQSRIPDGAEKFLPAITVNMINGGQPSMINYAPEFYVSIHTVKQSQAIALAEEVRKLFDRTIITESTKKYSCNCEIGTLNTFEDIHTLNVVVKPKNQKGE